MRTELKFTPVDVQTWDRREVFYYFSTVAPTGYSLTVELDITNMRHKLRAAGRKFYPTHLWLVTKLFNEQREFRTAKQEEQVGFLLQRADTALCSVP